MLSAGEQFDAVMALELIEHVDQPQQFVKTLASLTKSNGALCISTINRTPRGYALGILGAEYIAGVLPKGTHDWNKFITPGDRLKFVHILCCGYSCTVEFHCMFCAEPQHM